MSKRVLIVGASSGIGRELASRYAARDYKVGITARRMDLLDELKKTYPHNVFVRSFDVAAAGVVEHIRSLINELGGLDLLIYNAGYGEPSRYLDPSTEELTTRTNVNGFVTTVAFAFNYFVEQGYGQIALTSSVGALRGNSWAPSYSASKSFMSVYAEGLNLKANRLKKNIVITDIRPGFIDTKMAKGNGRFWVAPVNKATDQIIKAIDGKKRVAYVTKRWWLIAQLMKLVPYSLYKRFA
jgi:short-subunit dehydrogenase